MPKQKQRLPASIGLSVLLLPGDSSQTITVTVRWADYALIELAIGGRDPTVLIAGFDSTALLSALVETPGVSQFFGLLERVGHRPKIVETWSGGDAQVAPHSSIHPDRRHRSRATHQRVLDELRSPSPRLIGPIQQHDLVGKHGQLAMQTTKLPGLVVSRDPPGQQRDADTGEREALDELEVAAREQAAGDDALIGEQPEQLRALLHTAREDQRTATQAIVGRVDVESRAVFVGVEPG